MDGKRLFNRLPGVAIVLNGNRAFQVGATRLISLKKGGMLNG